MHGEDEALPTKFKVISGIIYLDLEYINYNATSRRWFLWRAEKL